MQPTITSPTDVMIVGGGPIGLTAGLWFGQCGYRVIIVEKYLEIATPNKRAFNGRFQQVGLNPESLDFLSFDSKVLEDIKIWGCPHQNWINISIHHIQDIMMSRIRQYRNIKILFNSTIESSSIPQIGGPARVIVACGDSIYSFTPELVVIADGKHDSSGTAERFFNFPPASQVTLSSSGIVGVISRPDQPGNTCLNNYSSDCFLTTIGNMHVRLLGSLQERYVALGATDDEVKARLASLSPEEIKDLLRTAYSELRDSREPDLTKFTEVSKTPIPIVLDYRKETIKLLEKSNTIVTVEGDAARKTTFFSGSGLNSGYKGLAELFFFCERHKSLIFNNRNLLDIDQALLEKDRASLEVSLELLKKGIKFILVPQHLPCMKNINPNYIADIRQLTPRQGRINTSSPKTQYGRRASFS